MDHSPTHRNWFVQTLIVFATALLITSSPLHADEVDFTELINLFDGNQQSLVENYFDGHVFGSNGYEEITTQERRRRRLERIAANRIKQIHDWCKLSEAQQQKLKLAAKIDLNRLFERVAVARAEFIKANADNPWPIGFTEELHLLRFQVQHGPFRKNTLFEKSLATTLTPEQLEIVREHALAELQQQHNQQVHHALDLLTAGKPYLPGQRSRLFVYLRDKLPPSEVEGPFGECITHYRASQLTQNDLSDFLTPAQWINWYYRRRVALSPILQRENLIPDLPAAAEPPVPQPAPAKLKSYIVK